MEQLEELPIPEWQTFIRTFSRTHRGWLMRMWVVDTVGLESGLLDNTYMVIRDLALWDIATERHGDRIDLVVMSRNPADRSHSDHPIRHIESIKVERDLDGNDSGLMISTAEMQTTVLRLRVPASPEQVDGLLPQERP